MDTLNLIHYYTIGQFLNNDHNLNGHIDFKYSPTVNGVQISGATGSSGATGATGEMGATGATGISGTSYGDFLYWNSDTNSFNVGSNQIVIGASAGKINQNPNAVAASNVYNKQFKIYTKTGQNGSFFWTVLEKDAILLLSLKQKMLNLTDLDPIHILLKRFNCYLIKNSTEISFKDVSWKS